jgi:hypothetical protein
MMRFWTAPPFGVLSCAAWWDGTANTNFVMPATPYWLAASGNPTLSVDCYAPDASNGNPHAPVGSTTTLTKYGAWAASTAYTTGQKILVGQTIQTAITGGTSSGTAPTWNPTLGNTTTDGGVTWTTGGTVPVGAVAYVAGDYHSAAFMVPHLHYSGDTFLPEYDDNRPKGDFVQVQWGFNFRAAQTTPAPGYTGPAVTWNGANLSAPTPGTMQVVIGDTNIRMSPCCPAAVGFVPFYSPLADTGGSPAPSGGTPPPPPVPEETFRNQKLFDFPGTFPFDDAWFGDPGSSGSWWMGAVATTMPDPFWQAPFAPDCTNAFQWLSDDGSGEADTDTIHYYPAPPLVEARATYPSNLGWAKNESAPTLPTGISLAYDVSKNVVSPGVGPPGISLEHTSVATTYGFYLLACANIAASGRFSDAYKKFTSC